MPSRPQLLVSVRNEDETRLALRFGADIVDLKEPRRGSLGRVAWLEIAKISKLVNNLRPLSVALGELIDFHEPNFKQHVRGVQFAKLGLSGMNIEPDWIGSWDRVVKQLPAGTSPVAVAYADFSSCNAPNPEAVLTAGVDLGCTAFLIDTFDKSQGSLFDHLSSKQLVQLGKAAKSGGMLFVLAGSLTRSMIAKVLSLKPDVVAIRGAACRDSRQGTIEGELIQKFKQALVSTAPKMADHSI
jgi:uncharacterized protein (UPF0264 family)